MRSQNVFLNIQILIITITQSQNANCDVNVKDGNYLKTWQDTNLARDRRQFVIKRSYNSRSLFKGVYGSGWCSNLDYKIDRVSPHELLLHDCNYIKPHSFYNSPDNKNTYTAEKNKNLEIKSIDHSYFLINQERKVDVFNSAGKINLEMYSIQSVQYLNSRVSKIKFYDKSTYSYDYDRSTLARVRHNKDLIVSYVYDLDFNLTQINHSQLGRTYLKYDDQDRIVSIAPALGCSEFFSYHMSPKTPNYYYVYARKTCAQQPPFLAKYEFWLDIETHSLKHVVRTDLSKATMFSSKLKKERPYESARK